MNYIPGTGAHISPKDKRTVIHDNLSFAALPSMKGGYDYSPMEILSQRRVGICTSISLVQNANKALNKKFSPDFHYLLQKKYVDGNWDEGSAIFSSLKVGKNYGFLPIEYFVSYINEDDRDLPYNEYIQKLKSIPESTIKDLLTKCTDKLSGYASVNLDASAISKAINASRSGVICRYSVGKEWYTSPSGIISWLPKDINPLRKPKVVESGHAIGWVKYDFSINIDTTLANTWSSEWNRQGLADTNFNTYPPTEVWIPYYNLTAEQQQEIKNQITSTQLSLIDVLKQYVQYLKDKINGVVKAFS